MGDLVQVNTPCGLTLTYELGGGQRNTVNLRITRVEGVHNGSGTLKETTYTVSCGFRKVEGLEKYFVPPCLQSASQGARSRLAQRGIVPQSEGTCLKSNGREREV